MAARPMCPDCFRDAPPSGGPCVECGIKRQRNRSLLKHQRPQKRECQRCGMSYWNAGWHYENECTA